MVQHAVAVASIAACILLCLVFIGLVYDLIAGYLARRRFAKLMSLKQRWLRERSGTTAAPPVSRRTPRPSNTRSRHGRVEVGRRRTAGRAGVTSGKP